MPQVSRLGPGPMSLPSVGSTLKIVRCPDEQGIEHTHPVDDYTLQTVRAVILAGGSHLAIPHQPGHGLHPSLGSLPTAPSTHSSYASLISQGTGQSANVQGYMKHT